MNQIRRERIRKYIQEKGAVSVKDLAHSVADGEAWHPGCPDVDLDLHAKQGADEERHKDDDEQGIVAEVVELAYVLLPEYSAALRAGEHAAHQQEVTA